MNRSHSSVPTPAPAYHEQDTTFDCAFRILKEAITRRAFPGASVAVTYRGKLVALKGMGQFTYETASPAVTTDTIYDLASVTKVVATTALVMVLYERGVVKLEMPLAEVLPEFARTSPDDVAGARRDRVTLRMLLTHSSGLPAYARLFERAQGREQMLDAACSLALTALPGTRAEYSDIGFLLLGEAITRLAGRGLAQLCEEEIFRPLGMSRTRFRPPSELRREIAPTERSATGKVVQGEVQDENARAFGAFGDNAAHAGVFAPALDVARFAEALLRGGTPILLPETVELFTRREPLPPGSSHALGWDTPSAPSQSGRYFSPRSFGHLGYAGTSLWIDPERQLSITLLTNRTWPDRKSELIKTMRPRFHDAVSEALGALGEV